MLILCLNLIIGYLIKDTFMKNVLLRLPPEPHRMLKMLCAKEGKSINKVVCDLIYEYIRNNQAVA